MKTEIIPVIHVLSEIQVEQNIMTCIQAGIEKIFLIGHRVDDYQTQEIAMSMKYRYPKLWIGVNFLRIPLNERLKMKISPLDAIWFDETVNEKITKDHLVFSGVDFKYQKKSSNLKEDCEIAMRYCNVICTSGTATGKAPNLTKIQTMREIIGDFPLAIASGVNEENAPFFKDFANYLMVATSITETGELISFTKLCKLIDSIK